MFRRLSIVVAAALCVMSGSAVANSIFGDMFDASLSENGTDQGTVSGTATDDGLLDINDAIGPFDVEIEWADGDSFDFAFIGPGGGALSDLIYSLSDLDFEDAGGTPFEIVGASFNRGASNVDGFLQSDENPTAPDPSEFVEPDVTFTAGSVTATFSFFNALLAADGVRLRYDVVLAPVGGAANVPIPAPLLLLVGGIAALAGVGRSRR